MISAGDDVHGGIDRDTAEIYEPPYLFKGARPTISSAPATVRTGTSFDVDTPNGNITKARLIAPSVGKSVSRLFVKAARTKNPASKSRNQGFARVRHSLTIPDNAAVFASAKIAA